MASIDFKTLKLDWKPNQYLAVPQDFDLTAKPHARVSDYAVDVHTLERAFRAMALAQPRVTLVREDEASRQVDFVQRSALFKFPDTITVQFFPRGEGRSSCAIYSRSTYGIGDMGVNKKRVDSWLAELRKAAKAI